MWRTAMLPSADGGRALSLCVNVFLCGSGVKVHIAIAVWSGQVTSANNTIHWNRKSHRGPGNIVLPHKHTHTQACSSKKITWLENL